MRKTNLNNKVESIKAASDSQYKMARTKMVIAAALTAAFGCVAAMVCTTAAGAGCISDSKLLIACNKTAMAIEMAVGNAVMSCQTACMVYGAGAAIAGMATISAYKSMQQSVVSADQLSTLGSLATPTGQLPKMIKSSEIIDPKNPMGALLDDPEVPAQTKNNIANFNASLAKINNQGIGIDFMNGNFSSNGKNYNANQISQSKEFNNSIGQAMNELHQPSQQTANRILNEPANRGGTNNRNTATTSTADDFRLSNPTNSNNTGRSAGYGSVNKINRAPSSFTGTEYFPAEPTQTIQYKNGETIHAAETRPAANGAPSLFVVGKPVMPIIERTSGFLAQ